METESVYLLHYLEDDDWSDESDPFQSIEDALDYLRWEHNTTSPTAIVKFSAGSIDGQAGTSIAICFDDRIWLPQGPVNRLLEVHEFP